MWKKDELEKRKLATVSSMGIAMGMFVEQLPSRLLQHLRCPRCGHYLTMEHDKNSGPRTPLGLDEFLLSCRPAPSNGWSCDWSVIAMVDRFKKGLPTTNHVAFYFYTEFRKLRNGYLCEQVARLKENHARITEEFTSLDVSRRVGLSPHAFVGSRRQRPSSGEAAEDSELGGDAGQTP